MSATATLEAPLRSGHDEFDSAERYEIIDGQHVEMAPMSTKSLVLASRLNRILSNYGIEHDIGEAYGEIIFKLPLRIDRGRRPDVAFVSYAVWPKILDVPDSNAWEAIPDLCVEVVSPTDRIEELMDKIGEYLSAGVRLVWVIYPRHGYVHVYESPTKIVGLTRADVLDGGDVLPGFRLPLTEILPQPTGPTPRPDDS